jgi:hypothetical protein
VLGNSFLVPAEIFSYGFQIGDTNFQNLPSQQQADNIKGQISDFHMSALTGLQSNAIFTRLVISAIDSLGNVRKNPDGSYMQRVSTVTPPTAGNGTSTQRPFQVASVVTLMTPRAGAAGRGRFYLPLPVDAIDANGQVSSVVTQNRANAAAQLMVNVNFSLSTGTYQGVVVVASSGGFNSTVTAVKVGSVLDTQRRRRNALVESYSTALV